MTCCPDAGQSMASADPDLGFSYRLTQSGELEISRGGRMVTRLRGRAAAKAAAQLEGADFTSRQQRLARLTGNYRRGNERQAK